MTRTFNVTFFGRKGHDYDVVQGAHSFSVRSCVPVNITCAKNETLLICQRGRTRTVRIVGNALFNARIVGGLVRGIYDIHSTDAVFVYRGRFHERAECILCTQFRVVEQPDGDKK